MPSYDTHASAWPINIYTGAFGWMEWVGRDEAVKGGLADSIRSASFLSSRNLPHYLCIQPTESMCHLPTIVKAANHAPL